MKTLLSIVVLLILFSSSSLFAFTENKITCDHEGIIKQFAVYKVWHEKRPLIDVFAGSRHYAVLDFMDRDEDKLDEFMDACPDLLENKEELRVLFKMTENTAAKKKMLGIGRTSISRSQGREYYVTPQEDLGYRLARKVKKFLKLLNNTK